MRRLLSPGNALFAIALAACGGAASSERAQPPRAQVSSEDMSGGEASSSRARSEAAPDRAREAAQLLDHVDAFDLDLPIEAREQRLARLAALELEGAELRLAQRACGEAHASFIAAERTQARARVRLEASEAQGEPSDDERRAILALITESDERLAAARGAFARCNALRERIRASLMDERRAR